MSSSSVLLLMTQTTPRTTHLLRLIVENACTDVKLMMRAPRSLTVQKLQLVAAMQSGNCKMGWIQLEHQNCMEYICPPS